MSSSPLDHLRVASPCKSDWNEMYGDDRRRYCGECQMNVYNLSGMRREEAESLLMNAEGRLCVRYYRRKDGTVLTKDCPVGWRAVKQKVSRSATAAFSVVLGFFAGLAGIRATESMISMLPMGDVPEIRNDENIVYILGEFYDEVEAEAALDDGYVNGRVEPIQRLKDVRVKAWVK